MTGGTYTLLLELAEAATVAFGAAGERELEPGWYAYAGSAFGPGGLDARVDRHQRVARGEHDVRHWHIDYLTGHSETRLDAVFVTEGDDRECALARTLAAAGEAVSGLGASDCDCESHVAYAPERAVLAAAAERAHETRS
ncbi:MAG: DUF123 domain-containing protein [Halarchaeum sp.]